MNPIKIEARYFAAIRKARQYNRIAIGARKCGLAHNQRHALTLRDNALRVARTCLTYLDVL